MVRFTENEINILFDILISKTSEVEDEMMEALRKSTTRAHFSELSAKVVAMDKLMTQLDPNRIHWK